MANKIIHSIEIDGVKMLMHNYVSYDDTKARALPAATTTNTAAITITEKGLYTLDLFARIGNGSSTGQRATYIAVKSSSSGAVYAETSYRSANQYLVYMSSAITLYCSSVPVTMTLIAQSTIACTDNSFSIIARKLLEVGDD